MSGFRDPYSLGVVDFIERRPVLASLLLLVLVFVGGAVLQWLGLWHGTG